MRLSLFQDWQISPTRQVHAARGSNLTQFWGKATMQSDDTKFASDGSRSDQWLTVDGLSQWKSEIRTFLTKTRQELHEVVQLAGDHEPSNHAPAIVRGVREAPIHTGQRDAETQDRLEILKRHLAQRIQERPAPSPSEETGASPARPAPSPPPLSRDGEEG